MPEVNGQEISDADQARLFIGQVDPTLRNAMWPSLSEEAQRLVTKVSSVLPVEGLDPAVAGRMADLEREQKERDRAKDIASETRAREIAKQLAEDRERGDIQRSVNELFKQLLNSQNLDEIPDLVPVIDGLLYRETVARINGKPGAMKSFVALDMAGHVSNGLQWNSRPVLMGSVVYLVAEGHAGIRKRVRAWEQEHGLPHRALFLPRPVQIASPEWAVFQEACRLLKPSLVIVDTQARTTVGVEESSNKEMSAVFTRIEELAKTSGACVLLIHHLGHTGSHGRGASSVLGAVQTEITIKKDGKGAEKVIVITGTKSKDDDDSYEIRMLPKVVPVTGLQGRSGAAQTSVVLVPESGAVMALPGLDAEATAVVQKLDEWGAPLDLGRDKLKRWLQERELRPGRDVVLSRAIRYRRDRDTKPAQDPGAELVPLDEEEEAE